MRRRPPGPLLPSTFYDSRFLSWIYWIHMPLYAVLAALLLCQCSLTHRLARPPRTLTLALACPARQPGLTLHRDPPCRFYAAACQPL